MFFNYNYSKINITNVYNNTPTIPEKLTEWLSEFAYQL